jgi:hypothetical protein
MPKSKNDVPLKLRLFVHHGLDLDWHNRDQAVGNCPFCGKEAKFAVGVSSAKWQCWSCKLAGNDYGFLRQLWQHSRETTKEGELQELSDSRRLVSSPTLVRWGVVKSVVTGEWLVPGYNPKGKLCNLYRYVQDRLSGKHFLVCTAGISHHLHAPLADDLTTLDPKAKTTPPWATKGCNRIVYCEGPWDAMALWECFRQVRKDSASGSYVQTGAESASLLADTCIVAVPGCTVWQTAWAETAAGKKVVLFYDSDHPRLHCRTCKKTWSRIVHDACPTCKGPLEGPEIPSGGWAGMQRAVGEMALATNPPAKVSVVYWGPGGGKDADDSGDEAGCDPTKPNGWDVRDHLSQHWRAGGDSVKDRIPLLADLLRRVHVVPKSWIHGRSDASSRNGSVERELIPCQDWSELLGYWHLAAEMTDGLVKGLAVMLACVVSTKQVGNPLWCKFLGPPGSFKTSLAEGLSTCRRFVKPVDTLTGLMSGYQSDKEGSENWSLALALNGMTLVIKEGDTLLKLPNFDKVMSQFRAAYDGALRAQYGNKMSTDLEGLCYTVIVCGTNSLRRMDRSELGERMFDCVVARNVDPEVERRISRRVSYRSFRDVRTSIEDAGRSGKAASRESPEVVEAQLATGGYVCYLRENAQTLLEGLADPGDEAVEAGESWIDLCGDLGTLVAYLRSRATKHSKEAVREAEGVQRELGHRLASQITRLAACLAVVLGKKEVDDEVMALVKSVAMDTAEGKTERICRALAKSGTLGVELARLSNAMGYDEESMISLMSYLKKIRAIEGFTGKTKDNPTGRTKYRLTKHLRELWSRVMDEPRKAKPKAVDAKPSRNGQPSSKAGSGKAAGKPRSKKK